MATELDLTWSERFMTFLKPQRWIKYHNDAIENRSPSPFTVSNYGDISAKDQARLHNGNVYNNNITMYNITYNRSTQSVATINEYQDELFEAAGNGHTPRVLRLIGKPGVKLDKADLNGMTALHHACFSGFQDTVHAILEAGARINVESPVYGTPLCLAVLKEREFLVEYLLSQRADPDGPGGQLGSPLHAACHVGNERLVKALIKAHARVDLMRIIRWQDVSELRYPNAVKKYNALTEGEPLIVAAREGQCSIVNVLLDNGADVNAPHREWYSDDFVWKTYDEADREFRSFGQTAIFEAAEKGDLDVLKTLVRRGAHIDVPCGRFGTTPLFHAIGHGQAEAAEVLIKHGANIKHHNADYLLPIHAATAVGSVACIKLLITHGAEIDARELRGGLTPLIVGATLDKPDSLRALLDHNVCLDHQNDRGLTAVMMAGSRGHLECLRILAEAGANLNTFDNDGCTALEYAIIFRHQECIKELQGLGAQQYLSYVGGLTYLHYTASQGDAEITEILLSHQDTQHVINAISENSARTALHLAASDGHANVVEILLRHGASPEIIDFENLTPVSLAALQNHRDVLEELFAYHASRTPPAVSPYYWPLAQASGKGHLELVKWLLPLHPADSKDIALQTAINLAREQGRQEVLKYLLSEQTAASSSEEQ